VRILAVVALVARAAHAEPELSALAPAPDARHAIAIGPAGEVYEPDGKGAWVRHRAIAIAAKVTAATRAGVMVIAATQDGLPFRLVGDGWTVVHLAARAKAIVGAGSRPIAAVGKALFALSPQTKLPDAPAPVIAVGATPAGVVIETELGLARLERSKWKPIASAPPHVAALLSDRLAVVDQGLLDLRANKTVAWPAGLRVVTAIATGDTDALAIAQHGTAFELVTAHAGKLSHESLPVEAPAAPVVGLAADRTGRVIVALRDGRLLIRERAAWSTVRVRDELPAPKPGAPPATSR
jgi:hypothetical protein